MNTQTIHSLHDIIADYDHFIIDLWGVMHDGSALYDGAAEALTAIHAADKQALFLSNAPRKSSKAQAVLDRLGINREHYSHVVTSGQVAHDRLKDSDDWGSHYYYLGPSKDEDVLEGTNYQQTTDLDQADFILNTGFEVDYQPVDEIIPVLQRLIDAKLPLLCVNPDLEVVKQDGTRLLCAGWVADKYAEMSGSITMVGKPHASVYDTVFSAFNSTNKNRMLAIGDNLLTDIRGANAQGIDSLLISGGILTSDLGEMPDDNTLAKLYAETGATPTYVASRFSL